MHLEFSGDIWYWRGPAPYHFVTVPEAQCQDLHAISRFVSYGWGCIPVRVQIGGTTWTTSLFPKNGGYIVPIKDKVRKAERLAEGDTVIIEMDVDEPA